MTKEEVNIETTFNAPIRLIKELLSQKEGIPIWQQRLVFSAKQLEDDRTINDYNIKTDPTLYLFYRLNKKNTNASK